MRRIRKMTYLLLLMAVLAVAAVIPASAADQTIVIKKAQGAAADAIALDVDLPDDAYGDYEIYRGTSSGSMQLLDTFSGISWTGYNDMWYTQGDKKKAVCFSENASLKGNVLFGDVSVKLGQTYYYQIVWKDRDSGQRLAVSNVVSAAPRPEAPQILRCYAASNNSVSLTWTKVNKAKGYEVYRLSGKKWKRVKTITKSSTVKFTNKGLSSGKTYQYKVRTYCTVNGKKVYSAFCTAAKVKTKNPTVKGSYKSGSVYGPSLSTQKLNEVRRVVQSFKDTYIKKGMSDYEKAWTAFCYIRANCDYARRGWQYNGANTAWGALIYGEAQCSGYARGMKALCDAIGVPCYYVHANSKAANPSHQWNMVKIDGKWYVLDAQGGFFLVGSQTWQKMVGMYWNTKGLPQCSKTDHPRGGFVSSEI